MKQTTQKTAYFHLPGLFEFYELYELFLPLFREHREYFYDWCEIASIYGAPEGCIWGGGRVGCGKQDPRAVLALTLLAYNRRIARRVVAISQEVQSIGAGNLYLQLEPKGRDEISQLTASVEQMRLSLLRKTSEEQRAVWRAAWADATNRHLERYGHDERIDHRSNAARGLDEQPTIHEGVTARALERKGMIADRCEINRQIKADNALLRELKAEIKKLTALVARTVPAIAEGLEKLRSRVLIFCYQLSHIRSGKAHIQKSLAVWKPELEHYTGLVQQIKEKSKERKTLVAEKKALPIYHVKRHKALAVRIAELTEDLEELRSEKALLVQKFEYAEDAGAEAFRKDIAIMEAGLKKLEAQEQKYSAELDKALDEYAELKAQAADFDSVELYKARQVLRPAQEKAAERQLEETLQKKPSFSLLLSAKQEISRLLGEDTEERQARQMVIRRQRSDPQKPKHFQR